MKKLVDMWKNMPPQLKKWIRGLEVAVLTGVVSAIVTSPLANFHSKEGIVKYAAGILVTAGGCVRLYLTQSPLQNVIKETLINTEVEKDGVKLTQTAKETTSGPQSGIS